MKFLQNRLLTALILPLSLFFTIVSTYYYVIEYRALKRAIMQNESFFKALMTLGFVGHKLFPGVFWSELPVDKTLDDEAVQDIAQKQIVQVVLKYLKGERLLNQLDVTTEISGDKVLFELKPATFAIALRNLANTLLSLLIWSAGYIVYLKFFQV